MLGVGDGLGDELPHPGGRVSAEVISGEHDRAAEFGVSSTELRLWPIPDRGKFVECALDPNPAQPSQGHARLASTPKAATTVFLFVTSCAKSHHQATSEPEFGRVATWVASRTVTFDAKDQRATSRGVRI